MACHFRAISCSAVPHSNLSKRTFSTNYVCQKVFLKDSLIFCQSSKKQISSDIATRSRISDARAFGNSEKGALHCFVVYSTSESIDFSSNVLASDSSAVADATGFENFISSSDDSPRNSLLFPPSTVSPEVMHEVASRLKRLQALFLLKNLYRDVIRSESVLSMPIPKLAQKADENESQEGSVKPRKGKRISKDWISQFSSPKKQDAEIVVDTPLEILNFVEDIKELAESLSTNLEQVRDQIPDAFPDDKEAPAMIQNSATGLTSRLQQLASSIEGSLSAEEKQTAELQRDALNESDDEGNVQTRLLRRLEQSLPNTDLVLASFKQRIATVDLSQVNLVANVKQSLNSLSLALVAVWKRLNGQPPVALPGSDWQLAVATLPTPSSVLAEEEDRKLALILKVEGLDKRLREVSRQREQRLRDRNVLARTRLASEIKALDDQVTEVRKELVVRTLEVEMSLILMALEEDLMDVASSLDGRSSSLRSEEEELLLLAEFGLLDAELAALRSCVERNEAILADDEALALLSVDVPDLRQRLGISDQAASIPLPQRVSLAVSQARQSLRQGFSFYWRGMRLLGGDVYYSARLFWAAVTGSTLKTREVSALRRTAKDVLVLVPFAIILIAPITPVGHVMVFSFLQRSFPGFFPSSFSPKRQEVMQRSEALKERLQQAASLPLPEQEEARQLAAMAEAETFETDVDEQLQHQQAAQGQPRPPRRLSDRPIDLALLQEQLPELARILKQLRGQGGAASRAGRARAAFEELGKLADSQTSPVSAAGEAAGS